MKKILALLLMLMAAAFAHCTPMDNPSKALCENYASSSSYINAGCCYKQIGDWGECTLNLLKGARHAEILWDLNRGPFEQGGIAKQYYNPEYYPSSGLGSDMGVCLHNYGDSALTEKVAAYYNWIKYYGYGGQEQPPFNMDQLIASFESSLYPQAPAATPAATPKQARQHTPIPTPLPTAEEENGWVLPVMLLVIIVVVGYLIFVRKKASPKQLAQPKPAEKLEPHKGYLYKAAQRAREREAMHTVKKKAAAKGKKK